MIYKILGLYHMGKRLNKRHSIPSLKKSGDNIKLLLEGLQMTVNFNNWKVTATYKGDKCWDCSNGSRENWNNHKVTVTNTENGKRTSFNFWASIVEPYLETEYDILNAFRCFVDYCLAGSETFHDFCGEFGYDDDIRKAEKIWKACQREAKKLARIYDGDIYDLLNSLEAYA